MILVVGLSHRPSPLAVRESLAFSREVLADALRRMRDEAGVPEAMILSTCNRVELYGRGQQVEAAGRRLEEFLCAFHAQPRAEIAPYLYRLAGPDAVRHAFRVAASLESMVIGEPQILGQVKEAYQAAEQAGTLGSELNALRNRSLAAAKRARAETGIGQNAVSVSYVAVELARKIFGELRDKNVLLVGAGKMSLLAARHLVRSGARATVLGGRTFEKAEELAAALGGRAVPFESLRAELAAADIVISGTGAPGIVIRREDVEHARAGSRAGRRHHRHRQQAAAPAHGAPQGDRSQRLCRGAGGPHPQALGPLKRGGRGERTERTRKRNECLRVLEPCLRLSATSALKSQRRC